MSIWHRKDYFSLRRCMTAVSIVLVLITAITFHTAYKNDRDRKMPLREYTGELPFAGLGELVGGEYEESGAFDNTIKVSSSVLAPVVIEAYMTGGVGLPDGTTVQCGVFINYCETIDERLAVELANEYERYDRRRNLSRYEELDTLDVGADYILAYNTVFPTVCMVKGNRLVHAYYYGYNPMGGASPSLEEWAQRLYDSM